MNSRTNEQSKDEVANTLLRPDGTIDLAEVMKMSHALRASHKLLKHYSELLNMYDGGERIIPETVPEWIKRCWDGMEMSNRTNEQYAHPTPVDLLDGIPGAHWRRCFSCGNEALHADNVTPHVCCNKCGSQDTRKLKNPTAQLLRGAGLGDG